MPPPPCLAIDERDRIVDLVVFVAATDFSENRLEPPENSSDVEAIGRAQLAEQVAHQRLRRVEREAVHRARDVDDEHVLARRNHARAPGGAAAAPSSGRSSPSRPGTAAGPSAMSVAGEPIAEDEVLVAGRRAVVERDGRVRCCSRRTSVLIACDGESSSLDLHARGDADVDVERVASARRLHACRALLTNWFVGRRLGRRLARVARADDGRIDELVHAVRRDEQLGVVELDLDRVLRAGCSRRSSRTRWAGPPRAATRSCPPPWPPRIPCALPRAP